jgi:hypothetical protein
MDIAIMANFSSSVGDADLGSVPMAVLIESGNG